MATSRSKSTVTVQPALDRLVQLARLGPDWDSYGGAPPSSQALDTARRLVLTVAERLSDVEVDGVCPYAVAPLADGCVQLTWRGPRHELEVEIGPGDNIGYLLVTEPGDGEKFEEAEGVAVSEVLVLVDRVLLPRGDG